MKILWKDDWHHQAWQGRHPAAAMRFTAARSSMQELPVGAVSLQLQCLELDVG